MLINLSNHSSKQWRSVQLNTAVNLFGAVIDLDFPFIAPRASLEEVIQLVKDYIGQCEDIFMKSKDEVKAVHLMGELTFCYQFIKLSGFNCVASTTERIVSIDPITQEKKSQFNFINFRNYE